MREAEKEESPHDDLVVDNELQARISYGAFWIRFLVLVNHRMMVGEGWNIFSAPVVVDCRDKTINFFLGKKKAEKDVV